jgi:AraC family L-rhamnose operon regulatory protein RhaS
MELVTAGRDIYPGYKLPLFHNPNETFNTAANTGTRYRLVFVENGTGVLNISGQRVAFIAPTLFCLNEKERLTIEQHLNLRAQSIYFHPSVINGTFTFEIARKNGKHLTSVTDSQDLYYLHPFVDRSPDFHGVLRIGPESTQRIAILFNTLKEELELQKDNGWPCRSRSFLLELLFLIVRIYFGTYESKTDPLPSGNREITDVILYLHSNYAEKITVDQLTKTFNTNRTTLNEKFNAAVGFSIIAYLIHLRIQLAAVMLRDTTLSISEILHRVGFNDRTHFSRTFRKNMGCSPSEYRKNYCWMLY